MSKLRRIMVGYNFLPDGEVAFHSARILAERANARLYVLHVVEPSPIFEQQPTSTPPALAPLEDILGNVRDQLRALAAAPELARLHVITDVQTGKPFVELIRVCHRCGLAISLWWGSVSKAQGDFWGARQSVCSGNRQFRCSLQNGY